MRLHDLEKILREDTDMQDYRVDTDALWSNVQPHIPKRKRRLFPFWLFGGALVIGTIGYMLLQKDGNSQHFISSENQATSQVSTIIKEERNKIAETNSTVDITTTQDDNIPKETIENSDERSAKTAVITDIKSESTPDVIEKENKDSHINNTTTHLRGTTRSILPTVINTDSKISTKISEATPTKLSNNTVEIMGATEKTDQMVVSKPSPEKVVSTPELNVERLELAVTIPSLIESAYNDHVVSDQVREVISLWPKKIHPFKQYSPKWSLTLGGGFFFVNKDLTLVDNEKGSEYSSRKAAETVLDAWNTSLGLHYQLNPKWKISTGVDYSWINEKSETSLTTSDRVELENVVVQQIIDGNTTTDVRGNVVVDRTTIKTVKRINTYSFVDIPIEIVFTPTVNRFSFDVGIGVSNNVLAKRSGFWHTDGMTEYDLSTDGNLNLKDRIGISAIGHVAMSYSLAPKFDLYSKLRYKEQLSSITSTTYGIDQKYRWFGIEAGIKTNF